LPSEAALITEKRLAERTRSKLNISTFATRGAFAGVRALENIKIFLFPK